MLTQEENELICRVGPGTPMGNLFREYWLPAMLSEEAPDPDCDPVRILMLGEQLIAFRDTNGKVGLIQNNCPHRGASLFFGRNEEAGLRCVYHGWKFDVEGRCIDMPNEPAESDFKSKVKAVAYPTQERGGIVWAYLGPRTTPPPLPDLEGNMLPGAQAWAYQQSANWFQILEGHIDTAHVSFLHYGGIQPEDVPRGTFSEYQLRQRSAHFEVIDTEGGASYAARRPAYDGTVYWRVAQWIFPSFSMAPPGVLGLGKRNACEVPLDDHHTLTYQMSVSRGRPGGNGPNASMNPIPMQPRTTAWYGRYQPIVQPDNDFLIDRTVQRENRGSAGFTGISGIAMQDAAITSSMGPIYDRRQERLGTSDAMVIRVRRRLIAAIRAHMQNGAVPPGVDTPEAYRVRSGGVLLPEGADWVEATRDLRQAFVDHKDLDPALNGPL
ncbi:MAG: Rieske 2Fe-2S domain-containing protein [Chloroflexi bacterium]|nr:Rieske 2Fe-2S domain-containing protein [Chloroflexota bacterium]MBV9600175.1 Rieske 2Fe-2S domain-containing protein [Chloroflexota bacterium]